MVSLASAWQMLDGTFLCRLGSGHSPKTVHSGFYVQPTNHRRIPGSPDSWPRICTEPLQIRASIAARQSRRISKYIFLRSVLRNWVPRTRRSLRLVVCLKQSLREVHTDISNRDDRFSDAVDVTASRAGCDCDVASMQGHMPPLDTFGSEGP